MARQSNHTWFTGNDDKWDFEVVGRNVVCRQCGGPTETLWCEHIQHAMVKNWDAAAIWDKDPAVEYRRTIHLAIPVFPTSRLWTDVTLEITEFAALSYQVLWEAPLESGVTHTIVLCYLNPGEGRNVIRQTLIERMWIDFDPKAECEAGQHKLSAQLNWQRHMESPKNRLYAAERWSVWVDRRCLWCRSHDPMNTPDDLVPDQEKTVWNAS